MAQTTGLRVDREEVDRVCRESIAHIQGFKTVQSIAMIPLLDVGNLVNFHPHFLKHQLILAQP